MQALRDAGVNVYITLNAHKGGLEDMVAYFDQEMDDAGIEFGLAANGLHIRNVHADNGYKV